MFWFTAASRNRGMCLGLAISLALAPAVSHATDYNVDGAANLCPEGFGGIALVVLGSVTPSGTGGLNGTPYYINGPFQSYAPAAGSCATGNTLFSWAAKGATTECIGAGEFVHVGVSVAEPNATVLSAFLYNTVATPTPCYTTTNLPTTDACNAANYVVGCDLPPPAQRLQQAPIQFWPFALTAWYVHADGKTLTVANGSSWPPVPCTNPVYVGNVRFEYFSLHQPLGTLNADSLRQPIDTNGIEDVVLVPCGDTLTLDVGLLPPPEARFVVVTATQDTVPTLDSPGASRLWIEETIVRPGEHVIVASSGPNGQINPNGTLAVPDGGNQTFTITPSAGYRVADVLVDGLSVGQIPTYTFSDVTGDHRISATFAAVNAGPDCQLALAEPGQLWPPDHRLVAVRIVGALDPDGDPVTSKIWRVTQDEPLDLHGHSVDAVVDSTDTCLLRAERDGQGNGRVYTLSFTTSDGQGGECAGSTTVCVPHDRAHLVCIDDGQKVDSTDPRAPGPGPAVNSMPSNRGLELTAGSVVGNRATIEYSLPSSGLVRLLLFDIGGRLVATIENSHREEGVHTATWNAGGLSQGVYFYRLQSGSGTVMRKVLILRR